MDDRQWATFVAQAGIQADKKSRSFTPNSWDTFSVDPSGDLYYMDFGAIVFVWAPTAITGTSDGATLIFGGLPEAIQPSADRIVASHGMLNNATAASGEAQVFGKDSVFAGFISLAINRTDTVANFATPNFSGWTNSGTKGLASGWMLTYVK